MLNLKLFRTAEKGFADLINWASLVDSGIVLNKNGALLAGYSYTGKDGISLNDSEKCSIAHAFSTALSSLESGWSIWIEHTRYPVESYSLPEHSFFPDPVTRAIDEDRRLSFMEKGQFFETESYIILQYIPPLKFSAKLKELMLEKSTTKDETNLPTDETDLTFNIIDHFKKALGRFEDSLVDCVKLTRLQTFPITNPNDFRTKKIYRDELVNLLNLCVTGRDDPINLPPCPMYLDYFLNGSVVYTGHLLVVEDTYTACISFDAFPSQTMFGIFNHLLSIPLMFRWSNRFIMLEQHEATALLKKYRRTWAQKTRGFISQVFNVQGGIINAYALRKKGEAEEALNISEENKLKFGYYTSTLILRDTSEKKLLEQVRLVIKEIQRLGVRARLETINTMEAFLGSLPGHAEPNIRKPLLHTDLLGDLTPLTHIWTGHPFNRNPLFNKPAPALMYAETYGATPFRFNLHVGDLGHTLVFGPTGSGKSTLLCMLVAQFRRYKNARITCFDKGRSMYALTHAVGGKHIEFGSQNTATLCPLDNLETQQDIAWAANWIADCYELYASQSTDPEQNNAIYDALRLMANDRSSRSLTDFMNIVQDLALKTALKPLTISGAMGHLLDGVRDTCHSNNGLVTYELEDLLHMGEKCALPVLLSLFRRFEKSLDGSPALLVLDEAWTMLDHKVFREKIREWLKTLRKANCAVVLATQSLSDAVNCKVFDVLIESCPTKILLPNEEADTAGTENVKGPKDLYRLIGLRDHEITLLKKATKKKEYYVVSSEGRRMFTLSLSPFALAFTGVSAKEDISHIQDLIQNHGEEWVSHWCAHKKINDPFKQHEETINAA